LTTPVAFVSDGWQDDPSCRCCELPTTVCPTTRRLRSRFRLRVSPSIVWWTARLRLFATSRSAVRVRRRSATAFPSFRLSVSHWLRYEQAAAHSIRRRFYVAEVELAPRGLVRVALTEEHGEGHVDVWAGPQALLDAVRSVVQGFRRP